MAKKEIPAALIAVSVAGTVLDFIVARKIVKKKKEKSDKNIKEFFDKDIMSVYNDNNSSEIKK